MKAAVSGSNHAQNAPRLRQDSMRGALRGRVMVFLVAGHEACPDGFKAKMFQFGKTSLKCGPQGLQLLTSSRP